MTGDAPGGDLPNETGASPGPVPPRWRRLLRGLLRWTGITLVVVIVGGALFLVWSTRRPFPQIDGELALPGLAAPVEVIRDSEGVPHIYASTAGDLLMAQGFVHAQDRFFQMDAWRHIGAGRPSEMFGDAQIETDSFIRAMGWHDLAATQYEQSGAQAREYLDAYASGVNAYLEQRSPAELAFEYTILELINHEYNPEPWTPVDTLVWGKVMSWDLRSNLDAEIDRALLLGELSEEEVHDLYPAYPHDAPLIVAHDGARTDGPGISPPPITALTVALQRAAANTQLLDAHDGRRERRPRLQQLGALRRPHGDRGAAPRQRSSRRNPHAVHLAPGRLALR